MVDVGAWMVVGATGAILALLIPFALHRLVLLRAALRGRRSLTPSSRLPDPLPRVTVQLPVYNEAGVVDRLLDAVRALDYPRDRLEIQLLDDSTDTTREHAARRMAGLRAEGFHAEHLHRENREGYKAGALEAGRRQATGDFILILDADFVPGPRLIRDLLPPFADPTVGMVQARWDHLNEGEGLLTRCQALLLDGHFFFEQGGRHAAGRFMSFNGTAGMWRRETLAGAGGWSADTLTEDLDISYRAQMAGWRFVFLPEVGVPAELPSTVRGLETQQQRWAQGGVQTGRKLLGRLWRGDWPLGIRVEGTIHLLGHLAHPLTVALGVLLLPSAVARRWLGLDGLLLLDLVIFASATLSFLVFYLAAGRMRGRPARRLVPDAIAALVLGVGLTAAVSRSVLRGLRGGEGDPFVRTPKTGRVDGAASVESGREGVRYRARPGVVEQRIKVALTLWMAASVAVALLLGIHGTLPLLLLFGTGWGWLAWRGTDPEPGLPGSRAIFRKWMPLPYPASQPSSPP